MMRSMIQATAVICLTLVTAACSRSPQVSFYTLVPGSLIEVPASEKAAPAVAVGPVTLPDLVDRPQLVVRVAANRVDILESHRWAEPLKSEIPRLIARDLGHELNSNRVSSYQQRAGGDADYRVLVDLVRFESLPGEGVIVEAVWTIRPGSGGAPRSGRSLLREKLAGGGYDELVAGYSRAIAALSRDLAREIRAAGAAPH
jgi:uncharacterized protein